MPIVFHFASKIPALKDKTPFSGMSYLLFKDTVGFVTFTAGILRRLKKFCTKINISKIQKLETLVMSF